MTKNTKPIGYLDPVIIKQTLARMDKDIATRFIASGVSLNPEKVSEAFVIACEEMALREKERAKKGIKLPPPKPTSKDLVKDIQTLFDKAGYKVNVLDDYDDFNDYTDEELDALKLPDIKPKEEPAKPKPRKPKKKE